MDEFKKELTDLLNRHSLDNDANCPDFILADYLYGCYTTFRDASNANITWHTPAPNHRSLISQMTDDEYHRLNPRRGM